MRFWIYTLGCPKNEVDGEGLSWVLMEAGHEPASSPDEADIVVVNTCGFIEEARRESLEVLREAVALKVADTALLTSGRHNRLSGGDANGAKMVIAAGCLAERYGDRLSKEVHGIDAILGTRRWAEAARLVEQVRRDERPCWTGAGEEPAQIDRLTTSPSAYVKIADGCNAGCTFCAIPSIKGTYRSRPMTAIVDEIRRLAEKGIKEVILIAQDTTAYGRDLGLREGLAELLDTIVQQVPELSWIRLLYAYPQFITPRLLETMARHRQVLRYVDLPLQHAHPEVLKRMGRPHGDPRELIKRLRAALPEVALRTTFIVGFPGETEEEFRTLLDFVEDTRFDRVGVFTYSAEEGTAAATMPGQVPEKVKRRRYDRAMRLQQKISLELNRQWVGRSLDVLIEARVEAGDSGGTGTLGQWVGRSFRDAPEIDGLVFVKGHAAIGQIVPAHITGAMEYDLVGKVVR
ncbi:MAG: 30S ribosomal protein S12 methylthiotransferase RimO [Chloroflexota bacterium]